MKSLLTLTAAAALAIGLAGTASAATPAAEIGPEVTSAPGVAQAGHYYYRYGTFWRGNCLYRYVYVTDGYRWRYRYRYTCY